MSTLVHLDLKRLDRLEPEPRSPPIHSPETFGIQVIRNEGQVSKNRRHVSGFPRWAWLRVRETMKAMQIETGTILIVDDDPDYARVVQLLLAKFCPQLSTVTLHSGQELISYLQGEDRPPGRNRSSD